MSDLAEFLLARIAEDERVAKVADIGVGHGVRPDELWTITNPPRGEVCATPARVIAECEAKRRIVERLDAYLTENAETEPEGLWELLDDHAWATLYNLAAPYADHPDYREEWKP